ncbi:UNVERIFIED_CONTAM: KH domain-containing protein [Sesamum calycinum]|uniref:KH domain-containing protein n=1 Tax=Sesamum calycinum TaxID=2727403 RepID=A0AAW2R709_9LAMI
MESRIPPGSYFQYAPTGVHGSLQRYLADLLAERQKLGPFMQILPVCSRLLNQEIMRVSGLLSNQVAELERMGHDHPYRSLGQQPNGGQMGMMAWNAMQTNEDKLLQKMAPFQPSSLNWHVVPGTPTTPVVKRVIRLDVPVEKYPNYNFVGRILGTSRELFESEAMTECRIFIRGQGSVKDAIKEEKLKDKPGYEHLNEPLHILVEAEFPEDIIEARLDHAIAILENLLKPVDESMDVYKKQQLRELAMLNGTFREESRA